MIRSDDKNGFICLIVMFIPRVTVIKMSQIAHILYFLLMATKNVVTIWAKYLMHQKILTECFQKMVWLLGFGVAIHEILRVEISEKVLSQQNIPKFCIFNGPHLANASSNT